MNKKNPNDVPKPNPKNKISLEIAINWADRWRKKESKYKKHNSCNAFYIPAIDLLEALAEVNSKGEQADGIRAYIGVEKVPVEGKVNQYKYVEKLMIVGVKDNVDMISSSDGLTLDDGEGDIYDFSEPCPHVCDDESPLNGSI